MPGKTVNKNLEYKSIEDKSIEDKSIDKNVDKNVDINETVIIGSTGFVHLKYSKADKYILLDELYWLREYFVLLVLYPYKHSNIITFNNISFNKSKIPNSTAKDNIDKYYLKLEYERYPTVLANFKLKNELNMLQIMLDLFSAIDLCHQNKIWHRDIKMDNIAINKKERAVLIDFSHAINQKLDYIVLDQYVVTYPYRPPELFKYQQLEEKTFNYYNEKIDIWSLGVILFEMLTGSTLIDLAKKYINKTNKLGEIISDSKSNKLEENNLKNKTNKLCETNILDIKTNISDSKTDKLDKTNNLNKTNNTDDNEKILSLFLEIKYTTFVKYLIKYLNKHTKKQFKNNLSTYIEWTTQLLNFDPKLRPSSSEFLIKILKFIKCKNIQINCANSYNKLLLYANNKENINYIIDKKNTVNNYKGMKIHIPTFTIKKVDDKFVQNNIIDKSTEDKNVEDTNVEDTNVEDKNNLNIKILKYVKECKLIIDQSIVKIIDYLIYKGLINNNNYKEMSITVISCIYVIVHDNLIYLDKLTNIKKEIIYTCFYLFLKDHINLLEKYNFNL